MRLLALLLLSCGCASVPLARPEHDERLKALVPGESTAALYVYRPGAVLLGVAATVPVALDGAGVGQLGPGQYVALLVRPGEHVLQARVRKPAQLTFVAEGGRSYYFRSDLSAWPPDGPGAFIEAVADEAAGRRAVAASRLIADDTAQGIRHVAGRIAELNLDGVGAQALVATASRAVDQLAGRDLPASADLEAALLRLRTSRPGLDERQVAIAAIRAMAASLQPAEAPPAAPRRDLTQRFPGLGLSLRLARGRVTIAGTAPGSPAAVAGLRPGEVVVAFQGVPLDGAAGTVMPSAFRGDVARFTVAGPGGVTRDVELRPFAGEDEEVECSLLSGRVLYLRPNGILPPTARRLRDYGRASQASRLPVVLDLRGVHRGTPGGLVEVADAFLAEGVTSVVAGSRDPARNDSARATPGTSPLEQVPVAVLIDGETRGAAEALAAIVQDHRRGLVRGTRTAGDGLVWTPLRIIGQEVVAIPVARMLRPSGRPLAGGVTPDVDDDGYDPGPDGALAGQACPGDAVPGALPDDAAIQRAAAALLSGR